MLAAAGGCKSAPTPDATPSAPPSASAAAPAKVAQGGASTDLAAADGLSPALPLADKFAWEKTHRRAVHPTVEETFAAFEGAGVPLTEKSQHVASVYGATYCMGAKGPGETVFSVCEYATPEAAKAGKEVSEKAFAAIPGRTLLVVKNTLLTARGPAPAKDTLQKAVDAFQRL